MRSHPFESKLFSSKDYYAELLHLIPAAKRQIVIVAMQLAPGPRVNTIFDMLEQAAKRGVDVQVIADTYSWQYMYRTKLRGSNKSDPRPSAMRDIFAGLQSAGVNISFIGKLGINPFKGRMHAKYTVVDDVLFSFGGVNFHDEAFTSYIDYMFRIENGKLMNFLAVLTKKIHSDGPFNNLELQIDKNNQVLVDGGRPKKSAIYELACELAKDAREVCCVSQMCPSGELANLIRKTNNYHCYFNSARRASTPTNISIAVDSARYRIHNSYQKAAYLHAKCLLFIMKDGEKRLITGSHNFSWRGVAYGTKEMALYSKDPKMWQKLYDFIQNEVA
jgi:phosphatidylserine/phosphatidylglycerophosphate/cardiolipin synthase-like enzyme